MNENLDLVKILKDCPIGTKLHSPLCGEVVLNSVDEYCIDYPIEVNCVIGQLTFTRDGRLYNEFPDCECVLFPSKDQRDWSKFKAPVKKFDPKTLMAFDKVLVRLTKDGVWNTTFFSHYDKEVKWGCYPFVTTSCKSYSMCIPYNEETKHLVGTTEEAPEYYRYWEE